MLKKVLLNFYFKYIVNPISTGATIANKKLIFELTSERLRRQTLNSIESGISDEKVLDKDLIVTLTTYGKRLYDVYLTIESVMQNSIKPNRIILWLEDKLQEEELPITLKKLQKRGLQIEYTKDIRSYKKLIPTLNMYPDSYYLTIDDDVIYNFDLIENLVNSYKRNPGYVHANRVHSMVFSKNGDLLPYNKWPLTQKTDIPSFSNFATGVGGVLYPPGCFSSHVLDENAFMKLAPKGDDIWFYAMARLNGYMTIKAFSHCDGCDNYLTNETVQDIALNRTNVGESGNDGQIAAVFKTYNIYDLLK